MVRQDRPNIVVLVMDTARAKTVLSNDNPVFPTLSKLAKEGACYTSAFTDAPWTLPSHASLFTGTSPSFHGAHADHKHLDGKLKTLAETLAQTGYRTASVTNNAWVTDEFGLDRGFQDHFRAWQYFKSEVDVGPIAMNETGFDLLQSVVHRLLQDNPVKNIANAIYGKFLYRNNDYGAARTNELMKEWLENCSEPFFLFANYLEPHLEYRPPAEFAMEFLNCTYDEAMNIPQKPWQYVFGTQELSDQETDTLQKLYQAEIAYLDYRIGEIVGFLQDIGSWENTLLFVVGDHGENIGEHGFMDHQYCLYDTLLHVPLIATGGIFNNIGTSDRIVQISDIFPTIVDILEIEDEQAIEQFQGQSFAPSAPSRKIAISEYMAPQPSIDRLRKKIGKETDRMESLDRRLRTIRTNDWKLIRGSNGVRELYKISSDTSEKDNIIVGEAKKAKQLEERLDEWLSTFDQKDPDSQVRISKGTKQKLADLGYF